MQHVTGKDLIKEPSLEKYNNRWDMASKLFAMAPNDMLIQLPNTDGGDNNYKFRFDFKNEFMTVEFSLKILPDNFIPEELDTRKDDHTFEKSYPLSEIKNKKYVYRKKLYIREKEKVKYQNYVNTTGKAVPEFQYFLNMFDDLKPILEYYEQNAFNGIQNTQRELMLIEYGTPFANDEDIDYQKIYNSYAWGKEHSDELLGGLHLGENSQEFQIQNLQTGDYEYIDEFNTDLYALWMFGEFSKPYGFQDIFHRMVPQSKDKNKFRYSIIFNLGLEGQ